MSQPETTLQETQRQVDEGAWRIERQQMLVVRLRRDGHDGLLASARMLLAAMGDLQKQAQEHLRREQAKFGDVADGPAMPKSKAFTSE